MLYFVALFVCVILCVCAVERSRVTLTASETNSTGYINASYVLVSILFATVFKAGMTFRGDSLVEMPSTFHNKNIRAKC